MSTCIVTCGPAASRIDEVRHISNFSTGELGTLLAEALQEAGHRVWCLRGTGATFRPPGGVEVRPFFANDDLLAVLRELAAASPIDWLFHAAALSDFAVAEVTDAAGTPLTEQKLSSAASEVLLRLRPAPKMIAQLRSLFPATRLVGWKYELDGTPATALRRAAVQMASHQTDACVLNGTAYGTGFAYLSEGDHLEFPDKPALVQFLTALAGRGATG